MAWGVPPTYKRATRWYATNMHATHTTSRRTCARAGNTNCFYLRMRTYVDVLSRTAGLIPEFVNPKYTAAAAAVRRAFAHSHYAGRPL